MIGYQTFDMFWREKRKNPTKNLFSVRKYWKHEWKTCSLKTLKSLNFCKTNIIFINNAHKYYSLYPTFVGIEAGLTVRILHVLIESGASKLCITTSPFPRLNLVIYISSSILLSVLAFILTIELFLHNIDSFLRLVVYTVELFVLDD